MVYRQTLILLLATALAASSADLKSASDRESVEVLKRAAARISVNSNAITSLTCVETIQREYFRPAAATLPRYCPQLMEQRKHPSLDLSLLPLSQDRLRLEVALSAKGEINAWPGASRFSDGDLASLVHSGPIGTGPFGVILNLIFLRDVKAFVPGEDSVVDGRRCLTYKFAVPAADSHFLVKSEDKITWLASAYGGVVHVDAETADPVVVTVVSNDLPPGTGMCQTSATMHLKRMKLGDEEVLLPDLARQRFVSATGAETENKITFSACRQYSAESTVSFYAEPEVSTPHRLVASKPAPASIPERIPFAMELLSPIDSDTAAAGDRFTARLKAPLRGPKGVIAPKGTLVEGRVSGVEINFRPDMSVAIGLTPQTLEIRGAKVRFAARLDFRPMVVIKEEKKQKGLDFKLPPPGEYAHEFEFPGRHAALPKGFVSDWVTAAPRTSQTTPTSGTH